MNVKALKAINSCYLERKCDEKMRGHRGIWQEMLKWQMSREVKRGEEERSIKKTCYVCCKNSILSACLPAKWIRINESNYKSGNYNISYSLISICSLLIWRKIIAKNIERLDYHFWSITIDYSSFIYIYLFSFISPLFAVYFIG